MKAWKLIRSEEETLSPWRKITRKVFEKPDGNEKDFYTWGEADLKAGVVIALTRENKIIVAEQFRPGPSKVMLDLPAGHIEPGEEPKAGALRELREETGYASDDVEFLGAHHWGAYDNLETHVFLARNCVKVSEQHLDEGEEVDVKLITIGELIDNALNDRMCDKTAVLLAYEMLKKIQEET